MRSRILRVLSVARRYVAAAVSILKTETGDYLLLEDGSRFLLEENYDVPLLLDIYTGAAGAYSLRKLRTAYAGSAIRVRRSSDSAEQDIGFVSGVLDTASLLSFVGAGDGFVTTWYDQSGNARNATQATATEQPKVVSSGVLVQDGSKPAISLDGDDRLQTAAFLGALSHPVSFAVIASGDSTHQEVLFDGRTQRWAMYRRETTVLLTLTTENTAFLSEASASDGSRKLVTGVANTTSSVLRKNGSQIASGNAGTGTLDGLTIGNLRGNPSPILGSYGLAGNLQELIVWNSNQSASIAAIESNINAHYVIY